MNVISKHLLPWLSSLFLGFGLITAVLVWFSLGTPVKAGNVITVCASGCDYTAIGSAVAAAANGDTILIGAGTYTENITITKVLTLEGDDPSNTIVDGNENGSVFYLTGSAVVTLTDMTITNGKANFAGGGVSNSGQLLISNTVIIHNETVHMGNEERGGGVYNSGILSVTSSQVISNMAATGGGIFNEGIALLDRTIVVENWARGSEGGGGIENWGDGGVLTVTNSTLYNNRARSGGGLQNVASAYLLNTTISGNQASFGGGIWNGDTITIYYSTISSNTAGYGGGISNFMTEIVYFQGTIIGNNHGSSGANSDCAGDYLYSQDYNLIEDTTGCLITGTVTHNITGVDPQLMPLDYYYFPLPMHPLEKTSPAVDAAAPSGCPTDDQRGAPRPQDGDGDGISTCDIGAYEYGYPYAINAYLPLMLKP